MYIIGSTFGSMKLEKMMHVARSRGEVVEFDGLYVAMCSLQCKPRSSNADLSIQNG